MLDDIVAQLKILNDTKLDELAALNLLHAKLNYIFSFKGIKFESVNNPESPMVMAYYAFNFVPSGGSKDKLLKHIDNHLLPFSEAYVDTFNENRLNKLELKHIKEMSEISDRPEQNKKKKEQEDEIKKFRNLEYVIEESTLSSLYQSLEIIKKDGNGEGAILYENSEFFKFFKKIVIKNDKTKEEFLETIFKFYDGKHIGVNTSTTQRGKMENIPLSCSFLSDPGLLIKNEKIGTEFREFLSSGMARRSFIYFDKNLNFYDKEIQYPEYDEILKAINVLRQYKKTIFNIFDNLEVGTTYKFSIASNKEIINWKREVDSRVREFYKFSNKLIGDDEILKLNIEHSTWKIIKLAVIYHILYDYKNPEIQLESFNKACVFFNKTHNCLEQLLSDKTCTDYELLYGYLINNLNKFVSKSDIRKQKFVGNREFSNWINDAITEVVNLAEKKNLNLVVRTIGRNTGQEVCIYDPVTHQFNVTSQSEDNKIIKGNLVDKSKSGLIETDTLD